MKKIIFWAVDLQKDFINPNGALYVKGAEEIKTNLFRLTEMARRNNITVLNTGDYHTDISEELSDIPDFKTTFPRHCIMGTVGSEFIEETNPRAVDRTFYVAPIYTGILNSVALVGAKNIVIYKDHFDVFHDNKAANTIVGILDPDLVVVYGITTSICVNYVVLGLIAKKRKVIVVEDAIKDLPEQPTEQTIQNWRDKGVEIIKTDDIRDIIKEEV